MTFDAQKIQAQCNTGKLGGVVVQALGLAQLSRTTWVGLKFQERSKRYPFGFLLASRLNPPKGDPPKEQTQLRCRHAGRFSLDYLWVAVVGPEF